MAVESVDIEFRARLDDFKKTLETIPGLTKKSARELTTAWVAEIKKAEKQGGDSIQAAAKEAEKLEKLAGAIGGTVGDGIRAIGTLAKGAGAGLSDVGVKLAAVGIAAGAIMLTVGAMASLGTSAVSTARGIEESVKALGEQDSAVVRNAETIRAANSALESADASYERLSLTLTGIVAPAIEQIGYAVVGAVELLIDAIETVEDVNAGFAELTGGTDLLTAAMYAAAIPLAALAVPLAPLAGLAYGVSYAFDALADAGADASEEIKEQAALYAELEKAAKLAREAEKPVDTKFSEPIGLGGMAAAEDKAEAEAAKNRLEEQQRKDAQAAKSEAQAQKAARATQQLSDIVQAALFAEMSEQEKILEVQRRQLERIDELEQAGASHAAAEAARAVARDAAIRDTMELQKAADEAQYASMAKALDGAIALGLQAPVMQAAFDAAGAGISLTLDNLGTNIDKLANQNTAAAMATASDWTAAQDEMESRSRGFTAAISGLADIISDNQARHLDKDSAEYRKNRKKQFAAHKAAAIAEAAINTALSVTKTLSQYAYPINIVLGALSLAAGVATIATIAAQKPQFYTGGMVSAAAAHAGQQADAVDATLHDGEGVLTRRGVASMGGPEAVRAANAGQGSGGATVVAVSMLDSRILGDVWAGSGPRGSGGLMARVDSRLHGGLPGRAPPRSR